ncbi:zinc metalloproteinase nas-4-like [Drosophila subpulchrella]|uniref:zinc metalloproteinase nas-4-like n=1 Tax=Drosophila subpulchrella TaxID=1486046 RepID=UPI0018A160ED|nr:zinc metalloproteinase nas-4-like [Drosophila subpulchrella]
MEKSQSKPSLFMLLVILGITLGHFKPMDLNKKSHSTEDKYFEGDIVLPDWNARSNGINIRNGVLALSRRWPGGVVPYEINGTFLPNHTKIIEDAFKEFHTRTCVRFKPRTTEKDYISIESANSGCWSFVGRWGGRQEVNLEVSLELDCLYKVGVPIHELMHALGFWHEQSRRDRDLYVTLKNKTEINNDNYVTLKPGVSTDFGEKYDYASVMHYSSDVLIALKDTPDASQMGQRRGFSAGDVRKINAMYNCNA